MRSLLIIIGALKKDMLPIPGRGITVMNGKREPGDGSR